MHLTLPSRGRPTSGFASCRPPLMSNVRALECGACCRPSAVLASQCWPQFFARVGCLYSRPASLRSLRLASRQRSLQAAPRSASCRVAPFNLGIAPLVRQQGRFKSGAQGRFAPTCCAVQSVRGAAQRQVRRLAPQSRIVSHRATWPASWQATRLWPCAGSALTGRSSGRATAGLTFSVPCRRTPLTFNVRFPNTPPSAQGVPKMAGSLYPRGGASIHPQYTESQRECQWSSV